MELRIAIVALGLFLQPLLAAAEGAPRYGGDIRATVLGSVSIPTPLTIDNHADATVSGLLFDSLYRLDSQGRVQPHLAASMPVRKGRQVRIALRQGVRFHHGGLLAARGCRRGPA